jgi:pilus assembly protein Flp/PilA
MNSRVNNTSSGATSATYPRGRSLGMSDILLRAQVRVQTTLYSLRHRQEGQGLVEYGLIIASIAILLIVAMLFLAGKIDDLFSETGSSVDSPGPLP